jgi:hypothetical protein
MKEMRQNKELAQAQRSLSIQFGTLSQLRLEEEEEKTDKLNEKEN